MRAGMQADRRAPIDTNFPARAEDFLRLLFAWSIPFTLLDVDDAVRFWNRGAAAFYGFGEREALGKRFSELVAETPGGAPSPSHGERTRRYEARHRDAAGSALPVRVTRTDLPAIDGPEGAFVFITDLTVSKALERRLARRVAQLSIVREIGECLQSAMSRLLNTSPRIPVVLNSAYSSYKDSFMSWAADAYIVKPAHTGELRTRVRELLTDRAGR